MTTAVDGEYAYGLGVGSSDGCRRFSPGGLIPGFTSFLTYYPELQVMVVVLTNTSSPQPAESGQPPES